MVYASDESGTYEVYVQPSPEGGTEVRVSTSGGTQPRWSKDGREVFYVEGNTLMAAAVQTSSKLWVDSLERLFRSPGLRSIDFAHYDVTTDGQHFVMKKILERPKASIHVVQNWFAEFRDRQ